MGNGSYLHENPFVHHSVEALPGELFGDIEVIHQTPEMRARTRNTRSVSEEDVDRIDVLRTIRHLVSCQISIISNVELNPVFQTLVLYPSCLLRLLMCSKGWKYQHAKVPGVTYAMVGRVSGKAQALAAS